MADSKCRWQCPNDWSEWSGGWRPDCMPATAGGCRCCWWASCSPAGVAPSPLGCAPPGSSDDFDDYYYFLASLGRKSESVATQLLVLVLRTLPLPERLLAVIDDSPTKRYGPEGRRGRHSPQPHARPSRPEVSVRPHLGHAVVGRAASNVGRVGLAVAGDALRASKDDAHDSAPAAMEVPHQARLGSDVRGVDRSAREKAGKTLWMVVDGFYTKSFLKRVLAEGVVVVGRLRKDAASRSATPTQARPAAWSRPPRGSTGRIAISLAKAGRTPTAAGTRWNVRALRPADRQDVQDVPGHLPPGSQA